MKTTWLFLAGLFSSGLVFGQQVSQTFVSSDIENFWTAYQKIVSTGDTIRQHGYLQSLYLDKGTPGLEGLRAVRNYSNQEFLQAINRYPEFWNSLKPNTQNVSELYPEIESAVQNLKRMYPDLTPATIYFTVGAFRSNGTTNNDNILIGCELALADSTTRIGELPSWRQPFYQEYHPRKNIALLCTHEYIHIQQKPFVENLLSMCLYEGVAEFVSCKATRIPSNTPAIEFGKAHQEEVTRQFMADLFIMSNDYNWLWGENTNTFKIRDLGYFVGYEICERYYQAASDKMQAIKDLVELDFSDEKAVEKIVDASHFLPVSLQELNDNYEKERPKVVGVSPFSHGSKKVEPGKINLTFTFSEPLDGNHTGIDFGPLGEDHFPKTEIERVWSDDRRTWTMDVTLEPDTRYQILISNNFRKENGVRLKPFLLDFKTKK